MSLEIACMFVALLFCTSLRSQISLFCSILAVALYMHFATSVIHEITNALGIHCFRFVHQFITTIFFSTCFHQSVSWNKFCLVTGSLGKRHNSHPRASVLPWTVIYHKWCLPDKKKIIFISITSAIMGMVIPEIHMSMTNLQTDKRENRAFAFFKHLLILCCILLWACAHVMLC